MNLRKWLKKVLDFLELGYSRQRIHEMLADGWIDYKEYIQRLKELDEKHE